MPAGLTEENNGIIRLFGANARTKILSEFIRNPDRKYNNTQIASAAGISRKSWYDNRDGLLAAGVIEKVDQETRYSLNNDHYLTPLLESIYRYNDQHRE